MEEVQFRVAEQVSNYGYRISAEVIQTICSVYSRAVVQQNQASMCNPGARSQKVVK